MGLSSHSMDSSNVTVYFFNMSSSYLQVITRSTMFMLEDVYYLPVGIRTVKVEGTSLLINNKPFYFKGFGKHEDADVRKNLSLFSWDHLKWNDTVHYRISFVGLCVQQFPKYSSIFLLPFPSENQCWYSFAQTFTAT